MKRPDAFLPANNASARRIADVLGRAPSSVVRYLEIVETVWGLPWFEKPALKETSERRVWSARVALLVAIFYEPTS